MRLIVHPFEPQWHADILRLCPQDEYRVLRPVELPSFMPRGLTQKFDSELFVASGSTNGITFYGGIGNRLDGSKIDQHPFMFAYSGSIAYPSFCFLEHGSWDGRTSNVPPGFKEYVDRNGQGNVYPLQGMPSNNMGSIHDLIPSPQLEGFHLTAYEFTKRIDNGLWTTTQSTS